MGSEIEIQGMEYKQELAFARKVVGEVGDILMERFGSISVPKFLNQVKGVAAEVDLLADNHIREAIERTYQNHGIFTEESEAKGIESEFVWLADALDGTINFVRGKRDFAVTLSLMRNKQPVLGVTYQPATQEEFYAEQNGGTYHNGSMVKVSDLDSLSEAIVHIETNFYKYQQNIQIRDRLTENAGRIHAINSSALELAYTACGKSDACIYFGPVFELSAGALLVQEAGGKVTDIDGNPFTLNSNSIIASNGKIHPQLEQLLSL